MYSDRALIHQALVAGEALEAPNASLDTSSPSSNARDETPVFSDRRLGPCDLHRLPPPIQASMPMPIPQTISL